MFFYLVVDQTATSTHVSACYNIFFIFTLKKYFLLRDPFFNIQSFKTHLDCFNSQVNNLDDMEREQLFFYSGHKVIFWKN